MNERAIMVLMQMLKTYEKTPRLDCSQYEAAKVAFSRCAIEEILQLILDHPWTMASDIINDFMLKMEIYRNLSITDEQKQIFSVLSETALEVLQEIEPLER